MYPLRFSLILILGLLFSPPSAHAVSCGAGSDIGGGFCRVFLTSTGASTWNVPSDWNDTNNRIETIGGGGRGLSAGTGCEPGQFAGGGGAYSRSNNVNLPEGSPVGYTVGVGGSASPTNGGASFMCNSTSNCSAIGGSAVVVGSNGGTGGNGGGAGGSVTGAVGTALTYAGGAGGEKVDCGGSGGGGAAGPNGAGAAGARSDWDGGGGGGGNGGGSIGQENDVNDGGIGGNNSLGAGGGAAGAAGTNGGGGGGGNAGASGGNGGAGIEWTTHGSGGGAGGAGTGNGSTGGLYGGGGSVGYDFANGGNGAQGIIVITYAPEGLTALTRPPNNLGLAGYWSFNEATSTIATDYSGNGNHGVLTNISSPSTATSGWTNGKRGGALALDTTDDFVTVPTSSSLNITTALTMAAWVKVNSVSGDRFWFGRADQPEDQIQYSIGVSGDEINFNWCTDDPCTILNGSITTNTNLVAGQWYHVVVTFDPVTANDVVFYVNGQVVTDDNDASDANNMVSSSIPFVLGEVFEGYEINGTLDEVRVYNRVLTAAQVMALYGTNATRVGGSTADLTRGSSLEQGLVGLWTFDGSDTRWTSASAGVAYDRSGNEKTGTFTSMNMTSAPAQGKIAQGILFDGIDDSVSATTVGLSPTDGTVSAWIKTRQTPSGDSQFFSHRGVGGGDSRVYFGVDASNLLFQQLGDNDTKDASAAVSVGVWNHAVLTWSGGNFVVYLNGVQVDSGSYTGFAVSSGCIAIGAFRNACAAPSAAYFAGTLDDVRVYSRALTGAEALQLYRLGGTTVRP